MKKTIFMMLISLVAVALAAPVAFAEEAANAAAAGATDHSSIYSWVALGSGLGIGLAALGTGIGRASRPTAPLKASPATRALPAR